ncbi:hypothetical protein [Priestia megaterium]|uniref:hypothetical protein n=1 Tax=Priestia megaterium TaxID=1404 RepID=UPI001FB2F919|nr:hypothetical protein [Priestia megaterium]
MILRHCTLKKHIPSILSDGYIRGSNRPGKSDDKCISFEEYKGNDYFLKGYMLLNNLNVEDVAQLFVDGNKLLKEGFQFKNTWYSKEEHYVLFHSGQISAEEYKGIGEYYFIEGSLSLEYLTDETKKVIGYLS